MLFREVFNAMTDMRSRSARETSEVASVAGYLPWVMFGLATSLYTYAFFQRVAPNVIVDNLMRDFGVTALLLGNLSAFYFYSYAGLQIPLGILLDRYGARVVLTVAALLCGLGSIVFAFSESLGTASIGQLLIGAGAGVPFVGALVIARAWLPPERFAFVTGLVMFSGMAGAFLGQAPLAAISETLDWRVIYYVLAAAAVIWASMLWITVRDRPPQTASAQPNSRMADKPDQVKAQGASFWADMCVVAASRHTWLISLYGAMVAGPILSFLSLWSVAYLMQGYDMSRSSAAATTSIVMIGWAIGAPISGWVADKMRRRKPPMVVGAVLSLAMWLILALTPTMPLWTLYTVLFVLGVAASTMGVMFALLREHTAPRLGSTATGLFNTICMISPALFQPLVGWLIDLSWDGVIVRGVPLYSSLDFQNAFLAYPICTSIAILISFCLRESHARQLVGNS